MTKTAASIGVKMEAVLTANAVPVSTVETIGFAIPPVVAVEANRPVALAPFMAVAVPPPAIYGCSCNSSQRNRQTIQQIVDPRYKIGEHLNNSSNT